MAIDDKERPGWAPDFNKYLFQTSPAFFMSISAQGKTMFMSEEMLQLLGYNLEEVVGKDYVNTFVPEDHRERLNEIFDKLGRSRSQVFDENILITKDGRELLVKWQWWSVFSKKSEFDFYFGVGSDITGFIRSEAVARGHDTPFPMLAENAMDIVWTVDIDLRFTYISHSITERLGYSVKEMLGYPLERVLTPASLKVVKKALSEELIFEFNDKRGSYKTRSLELELRHRDGFTLLTENTLKFLHDANRRPIGILIVTRDIKERRRKEEALRDKIIQMLFNGAPNPIFVTDESGRYLDANRAGLAFLECDKESLQVKGIKDFTPSFLKEATCAGDTSSLLRGRTFESDFRVNGDTKTLLLSVVPFNPSDRAILFWIGQDITSRKQAEEALRESEEKYRLLIEYQTDLVVKMDAKGRFLFVSPSYCRLFAKKEKDLLGESFLNLVCKEDRAETAKAMKRLNTPPHTCFIEHRVLIRDKQRYIAWHLKGIKGERGKVKTIVGGGRDISKRKKAEEEKESIQAQLLQAQKME
ncbi:MAG: PAS domain-containing protein, partial [bacterium]